MEGPSEAKMSCTDNKDGSCSVEYIPYEPGTYNLNITYGGQPIAGDEPLSVAYCCQDVQHDVFSIYSEFQTGRGTLAVINRSAVNTFVSLKSNTLTVLMVYVCRKSILRPSQ